MSDGSIISENGDLARLPQHLFPRNSIRERFGDACPTCYTERVLKRLRSLKLLFFNCHTQHEAVIIAEKQVNALTQYLLSDPGSRAIAEDGEFVNYPEEFGLMMDNIIDLGNDAHKPAILDFDEAHKRLQARASLQFVDRINAIRDNAQLYFSMSSIPIVRECMTRIVTETADMITFIQEYDKEYLLLLYDLDVKAGNLKRLMNDYVEKWKRHAKLLKKPKF
ncbi:hypothetical protein F4803DRAFT_554442 [Xylaria telfairii]|nr:hypothetical protein F4803DRAFT_554442 [Xylaria telfairii]